MPGLLASVLIAGGSALVGAALATGVVFPLRVSLSGYERISPAKAAFLMIVNFALCAQSLPFRYCFEWIKQNFRGFIQTL